MPISSTTLNYFCLLHCGGRPEGPEPLPSRDINFPPAGRQNFYLYDCTRRPKADPEAVSVTRNVWRESRVETTQPQMQSRKEFPGVLSTCAPGLEPVSGSFLDPIKVRCLVLASDVFLF